MRLTKIASILLITLLAGGVAAKQYYRFKNQHGRTIIKDQVTNEMIVAGYEIINDTGKVVERVAPGKTLAELEQDRLKQLENKKSDDALKLKIRDDADLLRQFSSVSDIIRNRDGQLLALEQRIHIQFSKSNLLKLQLEDQQRQAATHERLGQRIPRLLQEDIATTLSQIENNSRNARSLEKEKIVVAKRFENDIVRYKELESFRKNHKNDVQENDGSEPITYDCPNTNTCNKAWQLAQIYAKDNASGRIEIITNTLILTSKPEKETDLALSFSKIPTAQNNNQIVLEVSCHNSEKGAEICSSDVVKKMRMNYLTSLKSRLEQQ